MIREDTLNFGLEACLKPKCAPSICVEYHRSFSTYIQPRGSIRHRTITLNLLTKQVTHIRLTTELLTTGE